LGVTPHLAARSLPATALARARPRTPAHARSLLRVSIVV